MGFSVRDESRRENGEKVGVGQHFEGFLRC